MAEFPAERGGHRIARERLGRRDTARETR